MRIYPVPFSSKEEAKLIFNLAPREVLILSIGVGAGLVVAAILAAILGTFMLYCIPAAIPFIAASAILAFTKVKRAGCEMTLDDYVKRTVFYNRRPRHYLCLRSAEELKEGR